MEDNLALPHINKLKPYIAGKPIETLAREKNLTKIIKLASNENPYGASPSVLKAISDNISSSNLYPDPAQYDLKQILSKFYNITDNMLAIGNGSDELLQLIMHTFVNSSNNIIFPKYSFSSYQICANVVGADCRIADINQNWQNNLENVLEQINNKTKLICFANPNNPTGTYVNLDYISKFISQVPKNIIILLDEAYFEYIKYIDSSCTDFHDKSIELVKKHENLIVTRTFSKAYGLAGLRLGYSISSPKIAEAINKLKQPFNVNRLAQFAGIAALKDQDYIKHVIKLNNQQRNYLYQEFDKLSINYIPSYTNFITIEANTSLVLYNYLLDRGIIVRPINNYGLDNYLRISIGSDLDNKAFIDALDCYNQSI